MAPIEVKFLQDEEEVFNEKILSYVEKNSKNSILVQHKNQPTQDQPKEEKKNNTISFRSNMTP